MGLASNFFVLCTIMYIIIHKRLSLALPEPVIKVMGSIDFTSMQSSVELLYPVAAHINCFEEYFKMKYFPKCVCFTLMTCE